MRPAIGLLALLAGCASPDYYRPGPPITVPEPTYAGPAVQPPRGNSRTTVGGPISPAAQPPCEPMPPPQRTSFVEWLRSGRGWTWGRASYEPIRDEGLDRLMVDTITNSRPEMSREPLPPVPYIPADGGSWIFPSAPANSPNPGY